MRISYVGFYVLAILYTVLGFMISVTWKAADRILAEPTSSHTHKVHVYLISPQGVDVRVLEVNRSEVYEYANGVWIRNVDLRWCGSYAVLPAE